MKLAAEVLQRPALGIRRSDRRARRLLFVGTIGVLALSAGVGVGQSLALFTSQGSSIGILSTKAIFPGQRGTPAFRVEDASGGDAPVDRSSQLGFSADGRTLTSSAWSNVFSASRYLDFDMNASLPSGLATASVSFAFRFASASAAGTACYYLEVRRISSGTVLGTYGSSGSPLDCVSGTSLTLSTTSIVSSLSSTDSLNDLRIRVLGKDSGADGMVIDQATVNGSNAYASFTLYPVRFSDAADASPSSLPWELAN